MERVGSRIWQTKLCLEAFYAYAHCATQTQKPYTIEETLVKLRILEIIELVCFRDRKKMEAMPLSDDIMCTGIVDVSLHSAGIHRRISSNSPLTFSTIKIRMHLRAGSI